MIAHGAREGERRKAKGGLIRVVSQCPVLGGTVAGLKREDPLSVRRGGEAFSESSRLRPVHRVIVRAFCFRLRHDANQER
jgi:hypothetical protein